MKRNLLAILAFGASVLLGANAAVAQSAKPVLVYFDGSEAAKPGYTGLLAALDDSHNEYVSTQKVEDAAQAIQRNDYDIIALVAASPDTLDGLRKLAGSNAGTPLLLVSPGKDGRIKSSFVRFLPVDTTQSPVVTKSLEFSMSGGKPTIEGSSGVLMSFEPFRVDTTEQDLQLDMTKGPLDWLSGGISDWLDRQLEKLRQKAICVGNCLQQFLKDLPTDGITIKIKIKIGTTPPGAEYEVEVEATGAAVKKLIEAQLKLMKCVAAC